jgi:hypothetical protein
MVHSCEVFGEVLREVSRHAAAVGVLLWSTNEATSPQTPDAQFVTAQISSSLCDDSVTVAPLTHLGAVQFVPPVDANMDVQTTVEFAPLTHGDVVRSRSTGGTFP